MFIEFWYHPDGTSNGVLMHYDFLAYPVDWANHDCGPEYLHDDDFLWTYDTCYDYYSDGSYALGWHSM
jgi:hypothetical protein